MGIKKKSKCGFCFEKEWILACAGMIKKYGRGM